ncbi:MAG: CDP-diacylglycerol--glycerol-3-phosphate 3-phosphatidyltransferase [Clostridiales bacterium]|nr:CDP-diacylglycerol--glycerol-3-phosphate 3-phosphatidyltransferase [Clostridiales bacterium]
MNLPNRLTILRVILTPIVAALLYQSGWGWQLVAAAAFGAASLTDLMDGYIARKRHMESDFGRFVDPIADKVLITAAMVVLVAQSRMAAWAVILFISREFVISAFRLLAAAKGVVIAADKLGKYKTLAQTFAVLLATLLVPSGGYEPALGQWGMRLAAAVTYVALILSVGSCVHYIYANRRILGEADGNGR